MYSNVRHILIICGMGSRASRPGMEDIQVQARKDILKASAKTMQAKTPIHLLGCGTSYFASMAIAYAIQQIAGLPAYPWEGFEFLAYPPVGLETSTVIGISHTGTTPPVGRGNRPGASARRLYRGLYRRRAIGAGPLQRVCHRQHPWGRTGSSQNPQLSRHLDARLLPSARTGTPERKTGRTFRDGPGAGPCPGPPGHKRQRKPGKRAGRALGFRPPGDCIGRRAAVGPPPARGC